MELKEFQVRNFKNIIDSNIITVENDITCLVGKNESGKTAILQSLYNLNPVRKNAKFKLEEHYPAWLEKKDRLRGINLNEVRPIWAKFILSNEEIEKVENKFGEKTLTDNELVLQKDYNGKLWHTLKTDEKQAIKALLKEKSFAREMRTQLNKFEHILDLYEYIKELTEPEEAIITLKEEIDELYSDYKYDFSNSIWAELKELMPQFFYFYKFSTLPYSVDIKRILETDESGLNDSEITARSLLRMAAADDDFILNREYERRKRELENVANALTQDVLEYWSQNNQLRVNPDITLEEVPIQNNRTTVIDKLKIRIWDNVHFLSLPFDEHSTGFQWFFSFLAAFSEFELKNEPVIILLDEPGLGLHGRAQADFLRFIEERLAIKCQVIYSTHSPFMVQPNKLNRARIVEEKGIETGSKVSSNVLTSDSDTLFPLQGAIGYDLVQHLFINEKNLVVEGTSDFTYLTILSDFLKEKNRSHLKDDISIVPVGGADMIPTFVALLGHHLDVTVLVDARKDGNQKLSNLSKNGYLKSKRVITCNEFTDSKLADIEDIFEENDYLNLYNKSFEANVKKDDLSGSDQIVNKIARLSKIDRFDHGKPADYLLRNKFELLDTFSENTLKNYEKLFERINKSFK